MVKLVGIVLYSRYLLSELNKCLSSLNTLYTNIFRTSPQSIIIRIRYKSVTL